MNTAALTVKQLNLYVRSLIEGDPRLAGVLVQGEISNFKNHYSSGHFYFTLKDSYASVRCVMFRTFASAVRFSPEDGMQVIIRGKVSLYEKDGQYQLYAEEIYPCGAGESALLFEQIKAKLESEGLFDAARKKPLPAFPEKIAVVTSDTGAAVQDKINILSRRWKLSEIILCPVSVQGENAVREMLTALDRIYSIRGVDLIIIGRGGGSAEDLQAFNSEELARKVAGSPVPVISAVGHETDFTICDFAADMRAPTPSAAAELAVPDCKDIVLILEKYRRFLSQSLSSKYSVCKAKLDKNTNSFVIKNPREFLINRRYIELDRLYDRLKNTACGSVENMKTKFSSAAAKLETLSPLKVLSRGYAAVEKDGGRISSVKDVSAGQEISVRLYDGVIKSNIIEISKEKNNG